MTFVRAYLTEYKIYESEEQYKEMVAHKTGGLFRLAVGLMQSFSEDKERDYNPLLNLLGFYFQIRDDLLNITRYYIQIHHITNLSRINWCY